MDSASGDLQTLIDEFYDVWFRFHPDVAMNAGIHRYAGHLPEVDDDDMGALGSWLESTIVGLEEIDFHALDQADQLDLELLFGACRDEYQAILERDWRHRDPVAFLPFQTIYQLTLDSSTGGGRAALETCLSGVPGFLKQGCSQLAKYPQLIPRIWVDAALNTGAEGVRFLKQLSCIRPELRLLCDQASQAADYYLKFLEALLPNVEGSAACGKQRFQEQLRFKHHLPDNVDQHLELARRVYQEASNELGVLCVEQTGSSEPRVWLDKLGRSERLQGDERLDYAQQRCTEIHGLLADSGQFVLSGIAGLELRLMPQEYPPDCAPVYRPPSSLNSKSSGLLYLQRPPTGAGAGSPEQLTAWCVSHAWSGQHLQAAAASASPHAGATVRRANPSSSQQIGWSLYAEQITRDAGFIPAPEQALFGLLERLRRSLMAVLDIELHVHGMAASGALLQLQALPGHSKEAAARDLLALTRHPTQHLAGVVGWKLLDALRQWQQINGDEDLAGFHAKWLAQGCIAAPLVIRRVFGQQAWDWVEARSL
ncbi:MAG: DUF885 domain-containing protein [Gammaproteobacteria bacterium]|nr:DUF885 domain-containing protein [Gammaproteobacteria bacterium]